VDNCVSRMDLWGSEFKSRGNRIWGLNNITADKQQQRKFEKSSGEGTPRTWGKLPPQTVYCSTNKSKTRGQETPVWTDGPGTRQDWAVEQYWVIGIPRRKSRQGPPRGHESTRYEGKILTRRGQPKYGSIVCGTQTDLQQTRTEKEHI